MADVARLVVAVDSRGVKRTRDELGRFHKTAVKSEKATKKFAKSWLTLGKAFVAAGVGLAIRSIISAAAEQERTLAQLRAGLESTNRVSGQTIESLTALSAEMQRTTVFSNEMVEAAEGILLSFTNIAGEAFPRTIKAAANVASRMGTDLQPVIIQLGKALNDPVANLGALSRSGIQFTKEQKALIKEMWETNRAAEAQRIILDELETQYGNSARAAKETLGGAMIGLRNEWDDFKKALGEGIAPAVKPVLQASTGVVQAFSDMPRVFGQVWEDLLVGSNANAQRFHTRMMKFRLQLRADAKAASEAEKASAVERVKTIEASFDTIEDKQKVAQQVELARTKAFLTQQIALHREGTDERARLEILYYKISDREFKKWESEQRKISETVIENNITMWGEMQSLIVGFSGGMIDALFDVERRSELTFSRIAEDFAKMVAKMVLQQAVLAAVGLPSMFGPGRTQAANGAVFNQGRVTPMARGGVVTQPTVFPMARGAGLMGEAGPEAVMPLTRTPSGELGVKAEGAGVSVNIINNTGAEVSERRRSTSQGVEIDVVIGQAISEHIERGTADRAMLSSFGLQRQGRSR
jgi:hypothetical protein